MVFWSISMLGDQEKFDNGPSPTYAEQSIQCIQCILQRPGRPGDVENKPFQLMDTIKAIVSSSPAFFVSLLVRFYLDS